MQDSFEKTRPADGDRTVNETDRYVSEAAQNQRLQERLGQDFGSTLPPLYLQARSLVSAKNHGTPLDHGCQHYILEMREYLKRQLDIFTQLDGAEDADLESLKTNMLTGLDYIRQVLDGLDRKTEGVDKLLDSALECFLIARNTLSDKTSTIGEAKYAESDT